jgi:hypothetical protein
MKLISRFILLSSILVSYSGFAARDDDWGYCKDGKGYHDEALTQPKPAADYVCVLPDAYALGKEHDEAIRCDNLQKSNCQIGAGGDPSVRGDHNVPRSAFFLQATDLINYPEMRCACGCFTPDVKLLSTRGELPILELLTSADYDPFRLVTPTDLYSSKLGVSPFLNRGHFTVGPEENPVYKFQLATDENLTVTELHPMVVSKSGSYDMVQAKDVAVGDLMVTRDGKESAVTKVETYQLDPASNLVYNVDTKGAQLLDHVVIANGVLTGDIVWQNLLSERSQRIEALLAAAK